MGRALIGREIASGRLADLAGAGVEIERLPMSVQLSVRSANMDDDLVSLAEWLRNEREFRGRVSQVRGVVAEGELGGAFEMISVAIASGGMGTVLAGSLTTWLRNRPRTLIKVTRGDASVELESGRVKNLDVVVEKLFDGINGTD